MIALGLKGERKIANDGNLSYLTPGWTLGAKEEIIGKIMSSIFDSVKFRSLGHPEGENLMKIGSWKV